jgi:protein-serine/threonine kinase
MRLSIATPQSNAQHFSPIPYSSHLHNEPRTSQIDSQSSNSSHASSPESRPIDLRSPIFEEEEDETSSEAAIEPITPTDGHQTHLPLQEKMTGMMSAGQPHSPKPIPTSSPLSPNADTGAQPRPVISKQETPSMEDEIPQPSTPKPATSKRPTVSVAQGKDSGIKRAVSGFFGRRSKSQSMNSDIQTTTQIDGSSISSINGSESTLPKYPRQPPTRRMSATTFGYAVGSNTPPSPGSLIENCELETPVLEPKSAEFLTPNRKHRSSTGNTIRDRFSKNNISFAASEKETKHDGRHRSTSVDLKPSARDSNQRYNPPAPERQIWGMAADSGTGLKARRLSLSLPDDFMVDVVELYSEYKDQSKLMGRRGRSIGKGATSHVRLMNKKGASADEVYAVKEFRGKSTTENAEDYEKKVKSEFSIAKSAHHPNVVETFRLCSHNGRWNQVMEFCDHGDLFSLVSQKYLSREERLSDRLCLFKQLVQGLNYLHNHGIAHRDIKLENILITKDSKLKITDFGVSEVFAGIHPGLRAAAGQCGKEMGEVRLCAPGMCGSPPYVAPEVIAKTGKSILF